MTSPGQINDQHECEGDNPGAVGVACDGCRKAKLRCSRDRPTCSHCIKNKQECVYQAKRGKPGIKPGAIESIQRRLDAIEQRLDQEPLSSSTSTTSRDLAGTTTASRLESPAESILALLASELPKIIGSSSKRKVEDPLASIGNPDKRRRWNNTSIDDGSEVTANEPPLPPSKALESYVDLYFTHVHPWIPMLNQDRFRQSVEDPGEQPKLKVTLQAIIITVSRYQLEEEHGLGAAWPVERIREWIVMRSMESNTLEGLQALIIIAFNDIGNGDADRAWAIIASLSRTVEFLQLTMDPEDEAVQPICRPFSYLGPAKDWANQEERRRVFWNVFLLDRFCSITMGWNTSLTSIDVQQRLPCDGILWRKQEAVQTPYLGIWDKSTGGMEHTGANRPYGRDNRAAAHQMDRRALVQSYPNANDTDVSRIGAFAYCVEATESMSRVTTYFLQHRINPNDPEAVKSWLARFKELDLRLMHWKTFLPQKLKPNIPIQGTRMDPNLTLAHITHNASTILLHQLIAWPPPSWPFRKRLPSVWSADTCCSAGVEISTIARKYLESTPDSLPVTSPFAFCVYIAARMLLIHWRNDPSNHRLDEFASMTQSLDEMSRRWNGARKVLSEKPKDLAFKYASKLKDMHERCQRDEGFTIHVAGYTQELEYRNRRATEESHIPATVTEGRGLQQWPPTTLDLQDNWQSQPLVNDTMPYPPGPSPVQYQSAAGGNHGSLGSNVSDNSNDPAGMDEYLMDMDRVIAFNDGSLFTAGMENGHW